ncbi:MAG: hypothetical protein QGF78_06760 [Candidatus Bathyarchaeota archaeon]|nr:hypothetical protein [Candidatus Bathyarchaeota archaeon]
MIPALNKKKPICENVREEINHALVDIPVMITHPRGQNIKHDKRLQVL